MNGIFVTGIGTDVGKTWTSICLCHHLKYTYYKPIQAGLDPQTDTERVQSALPDVEIIPERYRLTTPASPHYSAALDGVNIELSDFEWPKSERPILVEGAGGPLVPINGKDMVIDIAVRFALPVILVVRHYLGSINHTLCAIEAIRNRGLRIEGMVISGTGNEASEEVICSVSGVVIIARIAEVKGDISPEKDWKWIKKIKS
ncbi:MAG: dethiobiotin synthetase [Sphingobacteriales bacterium]|jgi:dethiobiotin synthetase